MDHPDIWAEIDTTLPASTAAAGARWQALIQHAGWGGRYADDVLRETRRALYLALTGDTPISVPQPVGFCIDVMGKITAETQPVLDRAAPQILRPAPIATDALEATRLADITLAQAYGATRTRYAATFGADPDPEVWHRADPAEVHLWAAHKLNQPARMSSGRRTGIGMTVFLWGGGAYLWYVDGRGPDAGVSTEALVFMAAMGAASLLFAIFMGKPEGGEADAASVLAFAEPERLEFDRFIETGGFARIEADRS
jgi:hypothetical protein